MEFCTALKPLHDESCNILKKEVIDMASTLLEDHVCNKAKTNATKDILEKTFSRAMLPPNCRHAIDSALILSQVPADAGDLLDWVQTNLADVTGLAENFHFLADVFCVNTEVFDTRNSALVECKNDLVSVSLDKLAEATSESSAQLKSLTEITEEAKPAVEACHHWTFVPGSPQTQFFEAECFDSKLQEFQKILDVARQKSSSWQQIYKELTIINNRQPTKLNADNDEKLRLALEQSLPVGAGFSEKVEQFASTFNCILAASVFMKTHRNVGETARGVKMAIEAIGGQLSSLPEALHKKMSDAVADFTENSGDDDKKEKKRKSSHGLKPHKKAKSAGA